MVDWDDFDYDEPALEGEPDEYEVSARNTLEEFFQANPNGVFFGNQLAVRNEDRFFHWITHRAIADLVDAGIIHTQRRTMAIGSEIKLVWHRKNRYYKREAKRVVELVDEYGSPNICAAMGLHGEQMILAGFARKQFVMRDHNTRRFRDRQWTESEHNLDFIFERDGKAYGVEVKNTLSYIDRKEFETKIRLCEALDIAPVFAVRMLPKIWIHELINRGGYAMILKYQLYPWTHVELAHRVARELGLPVDAPKALAEGTMNKFEAWHRKKL
ncbi:MAG: hypothetical protein WAU45_00065 [Blastocatellia bacterium]